MITGISIENFKGIGERVEVKLRPLTLLFGPNSAGKSSILHALHYAREVFERHNLDAGQTIAGGHFVDLGGFGSFVHGRDRNRQVRLAFELDLRDTALPDYTDPYYGPHVTTYGEGPEDLVGQVASASVAIAIAWSHLEDRPYVSSYEVAINGEPFATISREPGRPTSGVEFNSEHPVFVPASQVYWLEQQHGKESLEGVSAFLTYWYKARFLGTVPESMAELVLLPTQSDAIPRWGERLKINSDRPAGLAGEDKDLAESIEADMSAALSQLIVGPGALLRDMLRGFRYLGPLRETLPREYVPPRFPDPARWAGGLGAWDRLHDDGGPLVGEVSTWLSDTERLNTGYQLAIQKFKELDLNDPLVIQLLTGRAFDDVDHARLDLESLPTQTRLILIHDDGSRELELRPHDVGIGISQLVPVVVTALDGRQRFVAIEQPELHLHPKLQAELGDLFIESALGRPGHLVLLETHSEVIPLRLMRRIRETAAEEIPADVPPVRAEDVAIYYVELHEGATVVTRLELGDEGQLLDPWPDGFFEEGFRERFAQ